MADLDLPCAVGAVVDTHVTLVNDQAPDLVEGLYLYRPIALGSDPDLARTARDDQ